MVFVKMHGAGNDFVVLDGVEQDLSELDGSAAALPLCDRRFGIGGDGLIIVDRGPSGRLRMTMFNPDGSLGGLCGNGARCFVRLCADRAYFTGREVEIELESGQTIARLLDDDRIAIRMPIPSFDPNVIGMAPEIQGEFVEQTLNAAGQDWVGTAVGMGNPHFVTFVPDVLAVDAAKVGSRLETHPAFPNRVNVHFVQVMEPQRARQVTWERGAGMTLACGSGACAVVAAGIRTGRLTSPCSIELPGGVLDIEQDGSEHLWMTGPAVMVYVGFVELTQRVC